jgi:hypothetical protein
MSEATLSMQAQRMSVRQKMAHFRQVMLDSVTAEDVAAVFNKLIENALEGSAQSAKLVLAYLLGRPGNQSIFAGDDAILAETSEVDSSAVAPETAPPVPGAAPDLSPEMSAFLSTPFTSAELDEARNLSLLGGGDKKSKRC